MHARSYQIRFDRLTRFVKKNSTASIAVVCVASFMISWYLSLLNPPVPRVHDEFSYLLAADTFAEGRLANPTHPMWPHFESMHIIQHPTYASKYPPGQGMILALGQVLCDRPIAGVWIISMVGVLACYWMLLGWVPTRWALIGASLLVLVPGYQIMWGQSYWGGTLAFVGGSLVMGAAVRLHKSLRVQDACLFASGSVLLAVTRPFEGVVLCLLSGGWLLVGWLRIGWPEWRTLITNGILPILGITGVGISALAYYNLAVTGSPFTMPYQVHERTYGICPLFLWQKPLEDRHYRHPTMAAFHREWSMKFYRDQQTWTEIIAAKWEMLKLFGRFWLPVVAAIPIIGLPWWRGRKLQGALVAMCLFWLLTQVTIWNLPHYLAPGLPLVLLVVVYGLRNLQVAMRHTNWLVSPVTLLLIGQMLLFVGAARNQVATPREGWQYVRQQIQNELKASSGKHLIFVDYDEDHQTLDEWVYNQADIDAAKVVWARALSEREDLLLCEYFSNRKVWRIEADAELPKLTSWTRLVPSPAIQVSSQRAVLRTIPNFAASKK